MNLRGELIQIWKQRINQKIDSSIILIEQIKNNLNIPLKNLAIEHSEKLNTDLVCDLAALDSSLARQRKDFVTSQICIDYVLKNSPHQAILDSFLFQFEMGIKLFVVGQWLDAIDYFKRSENLSNDPICKSSSLLNLALCYENIGFAADSQIQELKYLVSQFSGLLAAGITAQIAAFEFRSKWRANKLDPETLQFHQAEQVNQVTFLKAYWSAVGLSSYKNSDQRSLQVKEFAQRSGPLFNRDFRLRTLTLNADPRDATEGRISDFIERLYLWTRLWMNNPESIPSGLLALTLEQFPWKNLKELESITIDDQTMLLTALRWLAHYDNRLNSLFKRMGSVLKFNSSNKYFCDERIFQDQVFAENDKQQDRLSKNLTDQMTVDLKKFTIIKKQGERISSPSLAKAFCAIKSNSELSVTEFYASVFEGQIYDTFLNAHQLSSLLYKMNQLMGQSGFIKQRTGRIVCTNSLEAHVDTIFIIYPSAQSQYLMNEMRWAKAVEFALLSTSAVTNTKKASAQLSLEIVKASGLTSIRRRDVQEILTLSKTESQRLLTKWLVLGSIKRQRFGKATIYQIQQGHRPSKRVSA